MQKNILVNFIILLPIMAFGRVNEQTDWTGGAGVPGPVTNWGTCYYEKDSVTTANEGRVSLIADTAVYDQWTKHEIDSGSGILTHAQGFMPADIDNDEDRDLVAHARDSVVWYRNDGNWDYVRQGVGPAVSGGYTIVCVYPADIDKDSNIDILVAVDTTGLGAGLGWYKNLGNGAGWEYKNLDNTIGYHRVSATDVDLDGNIDVLAVDNTPSLGYGNLILFRKTGATFNKEQIRAVKWGEGESWRSYPADFNNDGYPDIYSADYYAYIYLNDGTGHFDSVYGYRYDTDWDWDGAWAYDINMDGWCDLITANQDDNYAGHPYGFYGHINDMTGRNYNVQLLVSDPSNAYTDGAIAGDLDLDGLADIAGTRQEVGWFRQSPIGTFTKYKIGNVTSSHWIYLEHIDEGCIPSIDLLVTDQGAHIVYENKMFNTFAQYGSLTSSIFDFNTFRQLRWFGWEACIPGDSTLAFYWRGDSTGAMSKQWEGPYYATTENDSFVLPGNPCYQYFQYKAEFRINTSPLDIAVLERVWVSHDTCNIGGAEEKRNEISELSLQVVNDKIVIAIPYSLNDAELCVYNVAGELVKTLYKGRLESRTYVFNNGIKVKGIYLVVLKWGTGSHYSGIKTTKFIKLR